jgi:hypothetical protein
VNASPLLYLNVAAEPATVAASDGLAATQRVHHGPAQPSALVLHVAVPGPVITTRLRASPKPNSPKFSSRS